jgi:hypothetical protein
MQLPSHLILLRLPIPKFLAPMPQVTELHSTAHMRLYIVERRLFPYVSLELLMR